jgi:hypothetical protein
MPHEMTRRSVCGLLLGDLMGTVACARPDMSVRTALQSIASENNLAILDLGNIDYGTRTELSAYSAAGARTGMIVLPKRERPCHVAISPDGQWMAWDNWSALPAAAGAEGAAPPRVVLMDAPTSIRSISLKEGFGTFLAISSGARRLALLVGNIKPRSVPWRLIVLNVASNDVEHDLTDLVSRFDLGRVRRLGISGIGDRVAIAFAQKVVVIDLPSHEVLLEDRGSFSSLSPDGKFVAFVDDHHRIAVVSLETGVRRTLLDAWWRTIVIGGWNPDGRYLLAACTRLASFSMSLVAVECATNHFAAIQPLGDGVAAGHSWIKRDLLGNVS